MVANAHPPSRQYEQHNISCSFLFRQNLQVNERARVLSSAKTFFYFVLNTTMDRNEGAARLVPVGIAYLVLGCLIVATVGNSIVLWLSLLAVMTGLLGAYFSRGKASIRAWVIWAFILLDGAIIASIAMALIA